MSTTFIAAIAAAGLVAPALTAAQEKPPASKSPASIAMTGCVSAKPDSQGRYTFAEADGIRQYRLSGSKLARWAGQRVELVGSGVDNNKVAIKGGLVGPQAGARGVALDPSQESVKRQPGGGGAGIGPSFPEFKVSQVKAAEGGACEVAHTK